MRTIEQQLAAVRNYEACTSEARERVDAAQERVDAAAAAFFSSNDESKPARAEEYFTARAEERAATRAFRVAAALATGLS